MPVSNHIRRLLLQTIADTINEVVIGFDGTPATAEDGAAGRPALVLDEGLGQARARRQGARSRRTPRAPRARAHMRR